MCGWRAGYQTVAKGGLVSLEKIDGLDIAGVVPGEGSTIVVSPLFHAHALINTSFLLACGLTQVLAGRFDGPHARADRDPSRQLHHRKSGDVALIGHAPGRRDARPVDGAGGVVGCRPIDHVTLEALGRAFPNATVAEGYGLTEGTCVVTAMPLVRASTTGSVASAFPCSTPKSRSGRKVMRRERSGRTSAANCGFVAPRSPTAISVIPRSPRSSTWTAGSRPATSPTATTTATCSSQTARRTC